jgi:hypothetical protein
MGSMGAVRTHHDLFAWQEAMTLVELIYRRTAGRNSSKEFVQYLGIASGSLAELDTQLELSVRLGLASPQPE